MKIQHTFRIGAALGLLLNTGLQSTPQPSAAQTGTPQTVYCLDFNSQVLTAGSPYTNPAGTFTLGGVTFVTAPFQWANLFWFNGGQASVVNTAIAAGTTPEMQVGNITLSSTLPSTAYSLTLKFGEFGGNLNLWVNGTLLNFSDFNDINGNIIAGVSVATVNGFGNDAGSITLSGPISQFGVGGQELWIDDLCFNTDGNGTPPDPDPQPTEKSDLGDAPDSSNHHTLTNTAYAFPAVVAGRYPTVFNSGVLGDAPGPLHARTDRFWLGNGVTGEREADLMPDSDGVSNILGLTAIITVASDVSNMDKADDGWLNRSSAVFEPCQTSTLVVKVSRSALAMPVTATALLNIWIDANRDGDWDDVDQCPPTDPVGSLVPGYEWIGQNVPIPVGTIAAGGFDIYTITTAVLLKDLLTPTHWLRFTLGEGRNQLNGSSGVPDGRGPLLGWRLGETEDFFIESPYVPPQQDPRTDLGDAPDSVANHWPLTPANTAYVAPPTQGRYPTVWQSSAPATDPSGPRHRNTTLEGFLGNGITHELEADQGPDSDGPNNIKTGGSNSADRDVADDGWLNPAAPFPNCAGTTLMVRVRRAAGSSVPFMYLNAWFDGNRDGDWADVQPCVNLPNQPQKLAWEWIVQNHVINMAAIPAGGFVDLPVSTMRVMNTAPGQNHWVRFTLSEERNGPALNLWDMTLVPPRADGRGPQHSNTGNLKNQWHFGETEDALYKPDIHQGEPGQLRIDKRWQPGAGLVAAGQIITYVIDVDHIGGTGPATTVMTDVLPAAVVPVGLPIVSNPIPSAGPLTAIQAGNAITWAGWLQPNSRIRIEQAVKVLPCFGPQVRIIRNTAWAQQTATAGGGVISDTVAFEQPCKNKHIWATDSVTYTVKLVTDSWDGTLRGMQAPEDYTGPCKPPYLCAEVSFINNTDEDVAIRFSLNGLPPGQPVIRGGGLAREDAAEPIEVDVCPVNGETIVVAAHTTTPTRRTRPLRFIRIRSKDLAASSSLQRGDDVPADFDDAGLDDAHALFRAAFFDIFVEQDDSVWDRRGSDAARCTAKVLPVKLVRTDLGDAPDSSNHFVAITMTAYADGTQAGFPSVFDPVTGVPSGPKHYRPEHFHLGPRVSRERDADQVPDNDIVPNLRPLADMNNKDRWDDGVKLVNFAPQDCQVNKLPVQVFIDPLAKFWMTSTLKTAYVNVWLDSNHNGRWDDNKCPNSAGALDDVPEHIVINHAVNPATLALGLNNLSIPTGRVRWNNSQNPAAEGWLRVTLTTKPISLTQSTAAPVIAYSDGRGEAYRLGETEDYLYRQGTAGQPGADVWVEKNGAEIDARQLDAGPIMTGTATTEWVITVGNSGKDTAENVVIEDAIPSGWKLARPITRTVLKSIGSLIIFRDDGTAGDRIVISLNGLPPGEVVRVGLILSTVHTPPNPLNNLPARLIVTNTVSITASNDINPSNNVATATVVVDGHYPKPQLIGPGDGTVCSGTFTVTGWALPGSSVQLYVDGSPAGTATAGGMGGWSVGVSGLANGAHVITATSTISALTSPASAPMNITVDGSLSYSPLSIRFTDPASVQHRPVDVNGRTDDGGWVMALQTQTVYTIEIRSCCQNDPNSSISVRFGATDTVTLSDPDMDGLFTGVYTTGARVSLSMTISVLCGGIIKDSDGTVLIDPYGNVTDITNGALIQGATVTAYELQGALYAQWNAAAFNNQINPQITLADGFYSFYTPPGTYQIAVTAPGFQSHRSADIVVTNALVRYDVALYPVVSGIAKVTVLLTEDGPDPQLVKVKPGTVVEFVSASRWKPHFDLTTAKPLARGNALDTISSGQLLLGESFSVKFDDLGAFTYSADDSSGTVVVENTRPVFLPAVTR